MPKKTYSLRLEEKLVVRLEAILEKNNLSKSVFIEDYLETFVSHFEGALAHANGKGGFKKCTKCRNVYSGYNNCRNCMGEIKPNKIEN